MLDITAGSIFSALMPSEAFSVVGFLVMLHYAGMLLALPAVVLADSLAVRMLISSDPIRNRRAAGAAHVMVFTGLLVLLMSGTALLMIKHTFATLSPKLILKLGLVALLCVNSLLLQRYILPLAQWADPPLAVRLPLSHLFGTLAIGCISLSCWLSIAAVAFLPPLQALDALTLYTGFGMLWLTAFAGAISMSLVVRYVGAGAPRDSAPFDEHGGFAETIGNVHALRPEPRSRSRAGGPVAAAFSLRDRLANLQHSRPVNDNPRDPAGERVQLSAMMADPVSRQRGHGRRRPDRSGHGSPQSPNTAETHQEPHAWRDVKRACRGALWGAGAISFATNLLMLTGPLFMLQVYDRVLTSKSVPTLMALFGLVVALLAFMGLLEALRGRLLARAGLRLDRLLSVQVFDRAVAVTDPATRSDQMQLMRDVRHLRQFIAGQGAASLFDMPWAPIYFLILFMFHWVLGVTAFAGAAVLVALSIANEWLSRDPVKQAAAHASKGEKLIETGIRNEEVLRAMGMGPALRSRWLEAHAAEALSQTRGGDISGSFATLSKTIRLVLQSGMLAMGAYLVLQGQMSAGVMIAASIIMSRALAPIETSIANWRGVIAARIGMARLAEAFAEPAPAQRRLPLAAPRGYVGVEGVFAGPIGSREPVLKGLSFELEPGDALGVLGASGSGKSTLGRLLVGVWPTLRGQIRLDGAALHHWPEEQLGPHIGYLPQTVELFDGTVAENIARFERHAEPEEIVAASRMANVHDMIQLLPDGYNTKVGQGGAALSGGHRQRIALARALYRRPALVVLDEPNSNLDSEGEAALSKAIATMREAGSTVVVLAHRRKALENVNKILVLKDGRQAAFGAKADILGAALSKTDPASDEERRSVNVAS